MGIVNVNDISGMIRAYVVTQVQKKYPDLDLSEYSAYDDLFIKPMVELLHPLFQTLNSVEMRRNLDNAEYMSEEELNELGEGNYLLRRNRGSKATAVLTMRFINVIEGEYIVVPRGTIFTTKNNLQFQVMERKVYTSQDLLPYYSIPSASYEVPIVVEASDVGTTYNVEANTITTCLTVFNTNMASVTNLAGAVGGVDKETNGEYAERIREFYISRYLGTKPGYNAFIRENFDEVEDVFVVGYKDEYMERDKLKVLNSLGKIQERHMGGMVDIYIKGCLRETDTIEVPLKTNYLVLSADYAALDVSSILIVNTTDTTKTPTINYIDNYLLGGVNKPALVLENTFEESYANEYSSTIKVSYRYKDSFDPNIVHTQVDEFTVGDSSIDLDKYTVEHISKVEYQGEEIDPFYQYCDLIVDDTSDETQKKVKLQISNLEHLPNGSTLTVSYVINSTIESLMAIFRQEENNIITADVLVKEAEAILVNLAFNIKMKDGHVLDQVRSAKIKSSVVAFFKGVQLGDEIQESDIISWLYNDKTINQFIEYIELPFSSFYIQEGENTSGNDDDVEPIRDGTTLSVSKIAYPVLNKLKITSLTDAQDWQ